MSGGKPADEVAVSFSDWFSKLYKTSRGQYKIAREAVQNSQREPQYQHAIETDFRVRDQITSGLQQALGDEFFASQTFIPAGRAFFTSLGRLVAGFEGGGNLDPRTLRFARLFANLRERSTMAMLRSRAQLPEEIQLRRKNFLDRVFGGEIKFQNEIEFVETKDGRKIPFTSLSSEAARAATYVVSNRVFRTN